MAEGDFSEIVAFRLRPSQRSLLDAAASITGHDSRSDAARSVLMSWARDVFRANLQDAMKGQGEPDNVDFLRELEREEAPA